MARPKFKIDYELVERLAAIHCTQQEIADSLGCSVDTLQRNKKFCGIYKAAIADGRMSLRRKQWEAVNAGNTTMLVWLGKQYLGQTDKRETEIKADSKSISEVMAELAEKLPV